MTDLTSSIEPTVLAARRAQLEDERDQLLRQAGVTLAEFENVDPEDPTVGRDAVQAALEAMGRQSLDEVAAALARIEAGMYGICTGCGVDIPLERLEIMPATAFCVACQQRSE